VAIKGFNKVGRALLFVNSGEDFEVLGNRVKLDYKAVVYNKIPNIPDVSKRMIDEEERNIYVEKLLDDQITPT
jgi:hypothetical protein